MLTRGLHPVPYSMLLAAIPSARADGEPQLIAFRPAMRPSCERGTSQSMSDGDRPSPCIFNLMQRGGLDMTVLRNLRLALLAFLAVGMVASTPAVAQQQQKPNILFIMGDDIGWMQPSIYHQGLMVGETPNIDRIGQEGARFMDYVAMQSCTSGRNAFFTGMYPLRTRLIPPELPGSPSYLRPGTPALAWFLRDLGYNTGEFGKNHLGDHTASLPTAHGFQEYWGYLYHLDAMHGVSF